MIALSTLAFFFLAGLTLICLLVLLALATQWRVRLWYGLFILTFLPWAYGMYQRPIGLNVSWLYVMPLVWVILTFRFGFPVTQRRDYFPTAGEPRTTQEHLRGTEGTREALSFYFTLLLIALVVTLVFYHLSYLP